MSDFNKKEIVRDIENGNSEFSAAPIIVIISVIIVVFVGFYAFKDKYLSTIQDFQKRNEKSVVENRRFDSINAVYQRDTLSPGGPNGRSRAAITSVVMKNILPIRRSYNKRLKKNPNLKGKITVKFAIDEFGKVIFCAVDSSTMNDEVLEQIVCNKIKRWEFGQIDKPGDVTEVVYPFIFSQ